VVVLERSWVPAQEHGKPDIPHYLLGHLQRWALRTSYPQIVRDVVEMVQRPPLSRPTLLVDATGVGMPIVEMLREAKPNAWIHAILITAGHEVKRGERGLWSVPKKELVSSIQAPLQSKRLRIADVPEQKTLVKELLNFKVKVSVSGNESFEAWREKDHDDLVLATALACWWCERPKLTFLMS
jgi:hypothetical protein